MKVKKVAIGVFLAFALVAAFSMNANAAPAWYVCTIEQIGTGTVEGASIIFIVRLKCASPAFTKWFTIPAAHYKDVLAIVLTAMSNGQPVNAWVDTAIADYHNAYVKGIYLLNQ